MQRLKRQGVFLRALVTHLNPVFPGVIAAVLALGLWYLGAWKALERSGYNVLFTVRQSYPHATWDSRIVVIAIDEASLKQYGRFPWSRDRYTTLLRSLESAAPAVIGFNILFAEPTLHDRDLAKAMEDAGNVVLGIGADDQGQPISVVPTLEKVTRQGHIYDRPDPDGMSRQSLLYINQTPALSIVMLEMYQDSIRNTVGSDVNHLRSQVISLPLPTPGVWEQSVWINWLDNPHTIPTYSFADVAQGKIEPSQFTNKIVLVGKTATGLDPRQTLFNYNVPTAGVYLHATVINNLLNRRFLQPLSEGATVFLLLFVGPIINLCLLRQTVQRQVIILVIAVLTWFGIAIALFALGQYWIPIAAPIGTMLLAGAGMQLRDQYEKQLLMVIFARLIDPDMAKMLWLHRLEIAHAGKIQPQELVATVVFIDIRGFTSISEKLKPRELLNWLNRYLDTMTTCIMEHGGVVDKYIGDEIMAVFGVPFSRTTTEGIQQDAINAIAACLAIHRHLQPLNQRFQAEGKPLIQIGIGVHTGIVVAGSVGSSQRMNYSILGDTVNVAARLESMNKEVLVDNPYNLLVSGETLSCLKNHYQAKPVGNIQLRGREKSTMVFSVLEN